MVGAGSEAGAARDRDDAAVGSRSSMRGSKGEDVLVNVGVARRRRRNRVGWDSVWSAVILSSMLALAAGRPLLGGSLTWSIDPGFASGNRMVTLTLQTAFEMDLSCTYTPGSEVACGAEDYGVLCVDQYFQTNSGTDTVAPVLSNIEGNGAPTCLVDNGKHTGTKNAFQVVRTKNVNGINVVFGKRTHTVAVNSSTTVLVAHWRPEAGGRGVMEVCDPTNTSALHTPCALNDLASFPRSQSTYWSTRFRDLLPQTPSLETVVPVCSAAAPQFGPSCDATNRSDPIGNYYSPIPVFPSFVEVAITSRTNNARPADTVEQAWFYNISGEAYSAPHVPILFKSLDYDGHQMTQQAPSWQGGSRSASNLEIKCFDGFLNGTARNYDTSGQGDWPWTSNQNGECQHYFDGEEGGGSLLKFDFDFGFNLWAPPDEGPRYVRPEANDSMSILFGTDQFRCAGRGLQECSPMAEPSQCSQGSHPVACSGNAMFSQHSIYSLDFPFIDVDNVAGSGHIASTSRWYSRPGTPFTSQVQSIFSAYPCWSGRSNQPPVFVKDLDSEPLGTCQKLDLAPDYMDVMSEVSCKVGELCVVPLHAVDFSINEAGADEGSDPLLCPIQSNTPDKPIVKFKTLDVVQIELAPGWDEGDFSMVEAMCEGTTDRCMRDSDCTGGATCTNADPASHAPTPEPKCQGFLGSAKCFFREMFQPEDVGKHRVRCFVAKDAHGDRTVPAQFLAPGHPPVDDGACRQPATCEPSVQQKTCRSPPMCIKIMVEGEAPQFVAPTPMDMNSYDDNGALIPGQTDVPACEGFPLDLTIAAKDDDELDLVRIFLEDKDIAQLALPSSDARVQLQDLSDEGSNLDFFAAPADVPADFWADVPPECLGKNASNIRGPRDMEAYGAVKLGNNNAQETIIALSGRKSVISPYVGQVELTKEPVMSVQYTLDVNARNGIAVRQDCASRPSPSCREKLLNMDQIVCGVAYDNSRFRLKRWVGQHDPNGNHIPKAMRDHSNGDMASPRHCWRIRLQSPPVFVTSPAKDESPFGDAFDVVTGSGLPTTGQETAYKKVQAAIGQPVQYTFVAQDPNPGDSVRIFIVDDPGMPPGMSAETVKCLPRSGAESMCRAEAVESVNQSRTIYMLDNEYESACSKAELVLSWEPAPEQAGIEFRVCVVARDSSTLCAGKGPPDATSSGWYGEQHCIDILVVRPDLSWVIDMAPNEIEAFVGCQTRFLAEAVDAGALYPIIIENTAELPEGTTVQPTANTRQGRTEVEVLWVPKRGTEGSTKTMCFTAVDGLRTQTPLEPRCWRVTVSKCRYCVGGGDTLSLVMKEYGLDTNWLRLWLHNGNSIPPDAAGLGVISNPDLIVSPHEVSSVEEEAGNAGGLPVIYVGPVYHVHEGESLQSIAIRFRTSIKSILSLNPDIAGEQDVRPGQTGVCLIPCSQRREKGPVANPAAAA